MTPHEKAVNAINSRLERLQASLQQTTVESAQGFIFQSIVATIGVAEALNDTIKMVGHFAQRRHGELKQANDALGAQHATLLQSGKELLESLKANPSDRALRKEIERIQQNMATIQKNLRRGANTLQREVAPGLAMIDEMSVSVRRLGEADRIDALKRLVQSIVAQVRELYAQQATLPSRDIIDADSWQASALAAIEAATDFYDAYARAGYQTILALELITLALSDDPPATTADAAQRANDAVAARLRDVTGRFTDG